MKFDFLIDKDGLIHIYKHDVNENDIIDFFENNKFIEIKRKDDSFIAWGITSKYRYLKVIFRKVSKRFYFIITAYDIEDSDIIDTLERNYHQ